MLKINTKYSGGEWLKECICPDPSPLGYQVANFLGVLVLGIYHIPEKTLRKVDWKNKLWIMIPWGEELATYDYDLLTRLVVLAHDSMIRVSISPRSNTTLELTFHPRAQRMDCPKFQRHPTIEKAIEDIGKLYTVEKETEV